MIVREAQSLLVVASAALLASFGAPAAAATHTFNLTTLFDHGDVPMQSSPNTRPTFRDAAFAGNRVIARADDFLDNTIGIFSKTPGASNVETIVAPIAISPTTGVPISSFDFAVGDAADLVLSTTSWDPNTNGYAYDIVRHGGAPNDLTTVVSTVGHFPDESAAVGLLGGTYYSVSNRSVLFYAELDQNSTSRSNGLYLSPVDGSSVTTLVDTTMVAPGTSGQSNFNFVYASGAGFDNSQAAFLGEFVGNGGNGQGLYSITLGADPELLIKEGASLPSAATGPSSSFDAPVVDDGDIAFRARGRRSAGLFAFLDGVLTRIVDTETPLPQDSNETFLGIDIINRLVPTYAIDAGRVLFGAHGSDGSHGVYVYDDGDLSLVLQTGDIVAGLTVTDLSTSMHALHGNQLVMNVDLADQAENTEGRVILASFGLSADFNNDFVVDSLDRSQWEGDYALNADSDSDGDGDTDGADFLTWQQQRPIAPPTSASSQAVPEPTTLAWLGTLAVLTAFVPSHTTRQRNSRAEP